ncbi:MAG: hypothetical protein FGM33_07555 [Candidatus Kapabacteria bacterium]|nr:hypothetical protein [Candidatus Kapabacteria bacterium]
MRKPMTNSIRRFVAVAALLIGILGVESTKLSAEESDSLVMVRLTSIDPELLQYFPRWYVCESDIQAKIFNAFRVLGYRRDNLDQQRIVVTAQPVANSEDPFEILIVECGTERMTAQEMSTNIPNILSKLSESARAYCYTDIPTTTPSSQPQTEAITSFLRPTNAAHSFTLSAFEQTLKIGKSGFWLSNVLGTDQAGYHFWNAGEAKVLLQRPLYVNDDVATNRAIPYLINARLGMGYRLTSDPRQGGVLSFIPARRIDAGYGGKIVTALDFNMPFHPQFGVSVNAELPLEPVKATTEVDITTYAATPIDDFRTIEVNPDDPSLVGNPVSTVNLLRSTGQVTFFYNLWLDPIRPENFFRFDLGVNYVEVREAAVMRTNDGITTLAINGISGLNTWKPNELGDWIYAKVEYRNQSTYPFGIDLQYANQTLLAHAYLPLFGQWLYLEAKYAQPLRGLRPFEREHMFMISPVLRLTL